LHFSDLHPNIVVGLFCFFPFRGGLFASWQQKKIANVTHTTSLFWKTNDPNL